MITRTADAWELYTCEPTLRQKCERFAARMNKKLEQVIRANLTALLDGEFLTAAEARANASREFLNWLDSQKVAPEVGACDTEPRGYVEDELDRFFPNL